MIIEAMNEEQNKLNMKSQPMKQYITDNVLPCLMNGLIEICSERPEKPLEYLVNIG